MLRIVSALVLALIVAPLAPAVADDAVPQSKAQIELTFAPLVKQAAPAVVNIYTRTVVKERPMSPFFDDPFFQQFFGNQLAPRERIQNSLGSGVIVRPDGLIVTNNHVIAGADEIRVVLNDGREFPAKVIAADEKFDLGILEIDTNGEKLPVLELKDSDAVEVGDLVLAIGDPFGVGQTVTMGIVSATARTNIGSGDYGYYIQTDAAINPGNSGGALISTEGKLVGINTAIYSKTGGSIGIGFAIPSNMVGRIIDAEAGGGKLVQPWIGVAGEAVTADIAASMGLQRPGGVVVKQVYPGGPGDKAGIQPGDVITAINGKQIGDSGGLRFRLATMKLGGQATVELVRQKATLSLPVSLIAAPEQPARQETMLKGREPLAGAVVLNLSPAVSDELGVGEWDGVAILKIRRGSYAEQFGLEPGDVLIKINGNAVATVDDVMAAVGQQADTWTITVNRNGQMKTIEVR
ncbi:MAG TPA: Do family serine endopeptidase [Candidatus Binatia bacterium]|nr:Do family serine endopeptidase [Candidatus Binatia bacterium]